MPWEDAPAFVDPTDEAPSGFLARVRKLEACLVRDIFTMGVDVRDNGWPLFGACGMHLTISIGALRRIYGQANHPASLATNTPRNRSSRSFPPAAAYT